MKRYLTQILTILILTSCQINNSRQEHTLTDIKKSDCSLTNSSIYDIETIMKMQKEELGNENVKRNFKTLIDKKIAFLNMAKNSTQRLFPYTAIDSVVYVSYEKYDGGKMNFDLNERQPEFATVLCSEKIQAVINLVNDPNNFGYGECGTQISEAQILFFNRNKIVAEIIFSCGHGQLTCEPSNTLTNFGGLNEIGNRKLNEIKPWR